jgi:hypothetical protein
MAVAVDATVAGAAEERRAGRGSESEGAGRRQAWMSEASLRADASDGDRGGDDSSVGAACRGTGALSELRWRAVRAAIGGELEDGLKDMRRRVELLRRLLDDDDIASSDSH